MLHLVNVFDERGRIVHCVGDKLRILSILNCLRIHFLTLPLVLKFIKLVTQLPFQALVTGREAGQFNHLRITSIPGLRLIQRALIHFFHLGRADLDTFDFKISSFRFHFFFSKPLKNNL